ncbi:GyrI-like domain-containing protein [Desulfovibrio sp. OttesenSCG-928-C06]|nr:GyrI-like domain-containing protein [Desulfovibrio sp. OttesenSCG-928-C06]
MIRILEQSFDVAMFPELSIIELPAFELAGIRVRTTMGKAFMECPQLWERFCPRMGELLGKPGEICLSESFGASTMVDMDNDIFDYWAMLPYPASKELPQGMERLNVASSTYAACTVPSLAQLGDAYEYIYRKWLPNQNEYVFRCAPCFEHYDERFLENNNNGRFDVLVPVNRVQQ